MLVKTSDYSHAIENTNIHYKMYKSKKNIVYASLLSATVLGGLALVNNNIANIDSVTAHADATTNNQNGGVTQQQNSTTTITPSNQNQKDQAVNSAQNSGVKVDNGQTKTINANDSNLKQAEQEAEKDYQDQINQANKAKEQQDTNTKNYQQALDKYNKDKANAEAYNKQQQEDYQKAQNDFYNKLDANTKKNDEIKNNNAEIDKKNQELTDKYNADKKAADDKNAAIDAENAKEDANFKKQKAEDDAYNAQVKADNKKKQDDYNTALAKYNKDWEAYKSKNNIAKNSNIISSGEIVQGLALHKEPDAKVSFTNAQGFNKGDGWDLGAGSEKGQKGFTYVMGGDHQETNLGERKDWTLSAHGGGHSREYAFVPNNNQAGQNLSVTATYTNLKNSSYTDENGVKHNIAKMVITYSGTSYERNYPLIDIFADPTDGIWYDGIKDIHVHMQMFDDNGNPITVGNNAWLSFSSLNSDANTFQDFDSKHPGSYNANRVESVSGSDNIQLKQLAGSSITLHGNSGYSDVSNGGVRLVHNSDGTTTYYVYRAADYDKDHWVFNEYQGSLDGNGVMHLGKLLRSNVTSDQMQGNDWDADSGPYKYYGSIVGLMKSSSNSFDFTFSTHDDYNPKRFLSATWAMLSTDIPTTPFNEQKPVPPTLEQDKPILPQNAHKPHVPVPDKPQLIPHQELIPFTETPPAPPVLKTIPTEPVKPEDLSIQQHNVVINYTPSPEKQWEENNVNTNNKIYMNGETPTADISVNVPGEANLKSFGMYEDYSNFAKDASVLSVHILHNGKLENDSDYTINDDKNGHLTITRNNMSGFTGGKYQLITQFEINNNVSPNTVLTNNGGVILNDNRTPVTPVKITTWNPNPTKDVNLGTNDTDKLTESANNWKIADGQTLTYPLQNITLPANRNTEFTSWKQVDNLDSHLKYNGYKAFLNGQDISSHIKMTVNGQQLTMTFDSWLIQQMNANKDKEFKMPLIMINATAHGQDGAEIDNKYTISATVKNVGNNATGTNGQGNVQEHTINLTSNTVRNYLIKDTAPTKEDLNTNGVNIDGMNVTPGSTQDYRLIKDFSSYKDAHISVDHQTFYWVDDWPEQALQDPDMNNVRITNQKGENVQGLTGKVYNSISELPESVQTQLKANNINPTDKFILWSGDVNFIKSQILAGNKVTINILGTVKDNFTGKYENKSYTITFGHGAISNVVTNNVEKINPTKDVVLDVNSTQSLANQTIKLGQVFDYKLNGQIIPANTGTPLTQYGWQDKFDTEHDQLTGQVKAVATTDIKLTDGTVLKKGTDLTQYLEKTINSDGSITWQFKKDFLNKVDLKNGAFGASLYVQAKRIKAGDVRNQYVFWLNGKPYKSNTVVTHTPQPATPKPQVNIPATPSPVGYGSPAPQLAQTGATNKQNNAGLIALGLASASLSLGMLDKKKEDKNSIKLNF